MADPRLMEKTNGPTSPHTGRNGVAATQSEPTDATNSGTCPINNDCAINWPAEIRVQVNPAFSSFRGWIQGPRPLFGSISGAENVALNALHGKFQLCGSLDWRELTCMECDSCLMTTPWGGYYKILAVP